MVVELIKVNAMPADRPTQADSRPNARPYAVLADGSAVFLAAVRHADGDRKLDYYALRDFLCRAVPGLNPPGPSTNSKWVMWTAADPTNVGQAKFLEFAEQRLGWEIRKTPPSQAFTIEPSTLFGVGGSSEPAKSSRLIRFDAAIAFAMGRLAESHNLIVLSDSYALREPIARINGRPDGRCVLAFFGHALDPRWLAALRGHRTEDGIEDRFIDLDADAAKLFGLAEQEVVRPTQRPGELWY